MNLQDYGITAKLPEVFDHTFTGTYLECERMAFYQTIWGRGGRTEDYSLVWGQVFHKIAEVWLKTEDLSQVIEVIDLNIPEEVDDRYGRNRQKMQDMFVEWLKYRRSDPVEIIRTEQPVVVACLSKCPYYDLGCNLTYGGRIDQIIKWQALVGPLDLKTTVMDKVDPIIEWLPNHQMAGYTWLTTHLTGRRCWGPIVEQIVANKSQIKVRRFPVSYPRSIIEEWIDNERRTHAEIALKFQHHAEDEGAWKQNWGRCAEPYLCKFRNVCLAPREAQFRLRWLRDNTVERRFDFRAVQFQDNNAGKD